VITHDVINESVRTHHQVLSCNVMPASPDDGRVIAHRDGRDLGVIDKSKPPSVTPSDVTERLLGQQAAIRAPFQVGQYGAVSVVVDLEQVPNARLRDHVVEPIELCRYLRPETRILGHEATLGVPPALPTDEVVAQVDKQLVEIEHPHMTGETLEPHCRTRLGLQQVEEIMGTVDPPLRCDRALNAELVGDIRQGPLEVRRHLARVPTCRAARHAVAFNQKHAPARLPQYEKRGRYACNAGAHHHHIGTRVRRERLGRTVIGKLYQPW
jgi:hypothetical protein